ncbi:hypothetical protein TNCV_4453031 [Trichonephila clavipes]|nr:hypothetical protein TNCV_4453031 [Trichonephila clavipes]
MVELSDGEEWGVMAVSSAWKWSWLSGMIDVVPDDACRLRDSSIALILDILILLLPAVMGGGVGSEKFIELERPQPLAPLQVVAGTVPICGAIC